MVGFNRNLGGDCREALAPLAISAFRLYGRRPDRMWLWA